MWPLDEIARANPEYVERLYQEYLGDPQSVDEGWAMLFAGYDLGRRAAPPPGPDIADLVHSYRELGYLIADLDPLGHSRRDHPLLRLSEFGSSDRDLDRVVEWAPFTGGGRGTMRDLVGALSQTYAGRIGVEYLSVADKARRVWLQERMETTRNGADLTPEQRRGILERLVAAEMLEQFLQMRFTGQRRYSLEGGEALIPLLESLIDETARHGAVEMVLGMAHRGRLNVLAHVLDKPYELIFAEFEGARLPEDVSGDGDVKYHLGRSTDRRLPDGGSIHLSLAPNPSHLEAVNPVVEGIVRAKQAYREDTRRRRVVPVLLHGDAAFMGQGIVYETLALGPLPSFTTGGTVHVIVNNQIGFTTAPEDYLFTPYPSDPAHVVRAPVFHVNGDDPEAVVQVARVAAGYRQTFGADVVIDFVCYRRHGHNELDDPVLTQPVMYEQIRNHPSVVEQYTKRLVETGVVDEAQVAETRQQRRAALDTALQAARREKPRQRVQAFGGVWRGLGWAGEDWSADTRVAADRLRTIGDALARVPAGFTPHPRVAKLLEERGERVARGEALDWGTAEALAYGSLLLEGTPVRVSGQDTVRGTFGHRHAAIFDAMNGRPWVPLNHLGEGQATLEAVNSPLSEEAVLGFEYGMSSGDPRRLVVWEAQFGDFVNGAQVIIDQFIASAESKWQRASGLVMLLPHGYEGQGPEHSSARLERFLQLTAERNIQVIVPTTSGQIFHALRRQVRRAFRKPLVVMWPKSLLRHPGAVSTLADLTDGSFRLIIDDPRAPTADSVRRVILVAGKIFHALDAARRREERSDLALVRIEQLYPFPRVELRETLARYPGAREIFWVQEEPANQGAWWFVLPLISPLLPAETKFSYVGRAEAASPATGNHDIHQAEEAAILEQALAS